MTDSVCGKTVVVFAGEPILCTLTTGHGGFCEHYSPRPAKPNVCLCLCHRCMRGLHCELPPHCSRDYGDSLRQGAPDPLPDGVGPLLDEGLALLDGPTICNAHHEEFVAGCEDCRREELTLYGDDEHCSFCGEPLDGHLHKYVNGKYMKR